MQYFAFHNTIKPGPAYLLCPHQDLVRQFTSLRPRFRISPFFETSHCNQDLYLNVRQVEADFAEIRYLKTAI